MIEILTFTGVDSETDLSELSALAERYPKVEFCVLPGLVNRRHLPSAGGDRAAEETRQRRELPDGPAPLREILPGGGGP